jgi:hypothetical protein
MRHAPLTDKYLHALRAVALGKVFRTYNSMAFKITGPCSSRLFWSLARMDLIADPPGGPLQGCHCMVLTAKGAEALWAAIGSDLGNLRALPEAASPLEQRRPE